jgi:hypothetical protein
MGHAEFHSIPRIVPKEGSKYADMTLYRAVTDGTDIVLVQVTPMKNRTEAEPIRIRAGNTIAVPEGFELVEVQEETEPAPPRGSVQPPDDPPERSEE